jgi:hypothetical protein
MWVILLLLAASALFAQTAQNGGTIMVNTPKGLFALRAGVLARLAPATLKVDKEMKLFGEMPALPAEGADSAARMKYYEELQKRNAPALMLVKDASLLVIIGDGFARINQETLATEKALSLKDPKEVVDPNQRFRQEPVPGYLLVGDTLFLMRSKEVMSINVTEGKIITRQPLPPELQTVQPNYQGNRGGGGRGPGGGGGNGGNGGGN